MRHNKSPDPGQPGAQTTSLLTNRRVADPTRTSGIQDRYADYLTQQYAALADRVSETLSETALPVLAGVGASVLVTRWLTALRQDIRARITPSQNPFIRVAYRRGLDHAREAEGRGGGGGGGGGGGDDTDAETDTETETGATPPTTTTPADDPIADAEAHRDAVQSLKQKQFDLIEDINGDLETELASILQEGIDEGWDTAKIARRIEDRIEHVGEYRATLIARTEVIRAHSTASLNEYERGTTSRVSVRAELLTAGDDRVCEICRALEGRTFEIDEMRTEILRVKGREVTAQPPVHPQCRCSVVIAQDNE